MIFLAAALAWLAMAGVAHAEPITAALFGYAFATTTLGGALVTAAFNIAASFALSGLAYLLTGAGKRQAGTTESGLSVQVPERSGLLERRILYGEYTAAGGVFFQDTVATGSSTTPNMYVLGYVMSDGICDGLVSVLINGVECELDSSGLPLTAPWNNGAGTTYLKVSFRSGTDTQAIDPIIASRFPSKSTEYRQRGCCTCVIEMEFGADQDKHAELWGAGGIPDIKFRIRGRKIYDPRDPTQDPANCTTWKWSSNATLVQVDWLMSDMGFGIPYSEIDWDSVRESANIDDRVIPTLTGTEYGGTINGVVLGSEANDDVLNSMALANRALIRRSFGTYSIRADRAWDPVSTIHQGLLVGDFTYQNETDTRSALNTCRVRFKPASGDNEDGEITYQDATLLAADGQLYETSLDLRFTDSPSTAQRLGYAVVTENRYSKTFTGLFDIAVLVAAGKPNGQLLESGDVVQLWFDNDYDAINGLYTVTSLEVNIDFTVTVTLTGYTPTVITGWSTSLEQTYEEAA